MSPSSVISTRELHSRASDGIHVRLLWNESHGRVWVDVIETKARKDFRVNVRNQDNALDVFHHPYAYAAHYGIEPRDVGADCAPTPA